MTIAVNAKPKSDIQSVCNIQNATGEQEETFMKNYRKNERGMVIIQISFKPFRFFMKREPAKISEKPTDTEDSHTESETIATLKSEILSLKEKLEDQTKRTKHYYMQYKRWKRRY